MHTRTLGQGLQVSAIGYGCMGLSQSYLPVPTPRRALRTSRPRWKDRCDGWAPTTSTCSNSTASTPASRSRTPQAPCAS